MALDITLATNRIQLIDTTLKSSVTYILINRVMPIEEDIYDNTTAPPTVIGTQWWVQLMLPNGAHEKFRLGGLASKLTWTNNAAGYAIAEAAIYAAFPSASNGGAGTVTSVSGGTTGLTVTNPTTTPTLAGTLAIANGGTGATTAATARAALGITNALLTAKTGAALTFDEQAEYNTSLTPSNASVTVNFTGAVAGTSILCWFNHGAQPTWPAGFTVVGVWNNGAANAVLFTYRTGTTVSGFIVSSASSSYVNPQTNSYPTAGADQTNTTVTAVPITGLSWTILAGKRYRYRQILKCTGTTTGGVCLGMYFSAGTGYKLALTGTTNTATAGQANIIGLSTEGSVLGINAQNTSDRGSVSASTRGYMILDGTVIGGTVNCTMDLRFSSFLAGQTATIFVVGSEVSLTLVN